jgi:riboflavin synthase
MFTGLIEDVGTFEDLRRVRQQAQLSVSTRIPMAELKLGESIAVNGVCLTVTGFGDGCFTADVSPETLEKSTLGGLARRSQLNLERALRISDRLGGHLVTGHVDGQGIMVDRHQDANAWRLRFQAGPEVMRMMVAKGSVAIDGISLTVNDVAEDSFSVAIIPHTLEKTNLKGLKIGTAVNLETDIIGKYVARLLSHKEDEKPAGISLDLLAKHGFL